MRKERSPVASDIPVACQRPGPGWAGGPRAAAVGFGGREAFVDYGP